MTSISKPSNYTYLSGAFQLKVSCFNAGLQYLCQHASATLAPLLSVLGTVSTSLVAITAAVAAWIAA